MNLSNEKRNRENSRVVYSKECLCTIPILFANNKLYLYFNMAVWDIKMTSSKQIKSLTKVSLFVDGCPIQSKMFSDTHSLYPRDASSLSLSVDKQKSLQTQPNVPCHLRTTVLKI